MRLLMLAPPGAGKGTQATRLATHFRIEHISSGDLLREEVAAGSDLGRRVRGYVEQGDLVPDDVVMAIVWDRVRATSSGFVLDGFPRTLEQARAARELGRRHGITLDAVVYLRVRRDELLRRLVERAGTEWRADDREDVIRHRLDVFDAVTGPLIDYYRDRGILVSVDGEGPVDEVTGAILEQLRAVVSGTT
jgi:adenylate kinase